MIKNVILDMGNVLLDYNPDIILDKITNNIKEKQILKKELFEGPEWIQGDLGYITNEEKYLSIKQRINESLHEKLRLCVYNWDICMVPIKDAKEFCKFIKDKGYGIYILSNASSDFYKYFPKHFELKFFDGIIVSSDIHIIKPDIEIYLHLLNKYNLKPSECLFIDDRADNLRGAEKVGMKTYLFKNDFELIKSKFF